MFARVTIGNMCDVTLSCTISRFHGEEDSVIGTVGGLTQPLFNNDYARITEEVVDIPDWCPLGDVG